MLPTVSIEVDWKGQRYSDVHRGLAAMGNSLGRSFEEVTPMIKTILRQYMEGVVKSVAARTATPYPGGTSKAGAFPGTLSKRSGKLNASLNPNRIQVAGEISQEITVGFTLTGIAAVHEKGAVIVPKSAKYLTIPLPAALTARGTPKLPNARAWSNTFVQRSKKGNLLIFQKKKDGSIVPLYVLVKQVIIPKRLNFEEAFLSGKDFLADKIAQSILREFNTNVA